MRQRNGKIAATLVCSALCLAASPGRQARAAEFQFKPSLALSEEFNDNIFETATDRRTDFVTKVQPGALLLYQGPALTGDLGYSFDYRNYARGSRGDEKSHTAAFRGSAELRRNFLYLELSDRLSRVSLDVARDVTGESQFLNQTDQNRASVSPFLLWHPGESGVLKTGYRYTDTRYWTVSGNASGIDKLEHRAFAELVHDLAARVSLSAGYAFSSVATEQVDYDQHDLSAGIRYEYAEHSFLFGGVGNSWQSFPDARNASNLFWNAGVTNDFGLLVATVEAKVQYAEDPLAVSTKETSYSARLDKALQHGALGLSGSYSEYLATRSREEERSKTAFAGYGRFELSPGLTASLAASGDKVTGATVSGYPYHLSGSAGLRYTFNYEITAALTYSYVDYRRELDSAADTRQTNRVLLEVGKVFFSP